ncbi:phosphoribosyltransferase [Aliiroseovarius sp. PrR006]|uniref:phosphoribosyltransferase n=1 Tax=Aliiroseovarius sp. PrR006 TaxID=2706883 RepID=UPI0013D57C28|nr:phosphoribosyltransferase [Aliiroseovarius sp. PrR006]NDW53412.1 phosphoribosyltransferase [Aliiroseovarius sp. PrR006]
MFTNRHQAGDALAARVIDLDLSSPLVLALPRGGVPVALPVARALDAPLDLLMVRKLGLPGHAELAAGAVVDGARTDVVFNTDVLRRAGLTEADFDKMIADKLSQIEARRAMYLSGHAPLDAAGQDVIVVDDGIATGATVKAALKALRRRDPRQIILAVPVAPQDGIDELQSQVDGVVCIETPHPFYAVGAHYRSFEQVSDEDVVQMLQDYWNEQERST